MATATPGVLSDGLWNESHEEWFAVRDGPTLTRILELAEPFDLTRVEMVNSGEAGDAGSAVKKLRLEHGASMTGPFKPFAEVSLKRGKAVQKFSVPTTKSVRYLRLTFR